MNKSELERFLYMFNQLDKEDKHEIIGNMKAMLFADKYRKKDGKVFSLNTYRKEVQQ